MYRIMKCVLVFLSLLMALSFGVVFGEEAATNATPMKEMTTEKFPVMMNNIEFSRTAQTIEIKNNGASSQDLTGWKLEVLNKTVYTFPKFMLDANAQVKVHSGTGKDSKVDLYAKEALLTNAGENVSLLNANGAVVYTSKARVEDRVKDLEARLKNVETDLSKSSGKTKAATEKDIEKLESSVKEVEQKIKAKL